MDERTTERLLTLNREFYAEFAEHFAATRSISDPALTSALPHIPRRARVLDVGCGNGRLALLLDRERPGAAYVGVDAVPELIAVARAEAEQLTNVSATFRVLDITQAGWTDALPSAASEMERSEARFDCAVMLAVLHHIPSFDLRARVLRDIAGVLRPGGCAVISTWRFMAHERIRRKIVDWSIVDIDEETLDPGDYLLDWRRGGRGFRYCHLIDEDEVDRLAAASGFRVRETFRAGGREGDLSLFAVLDKA
jgi:SAM-dependent methyltransferase